MTNSNNNLAEVLTKKDIDPAGLHQRIDDVIEKMMTLSQAEAPVYHRFAPGLYIREIHLKAGTFVIGHNHVTEHFNIMLQGHLIMINDDGTTTNFIAPQSYVSKPGHKVVMILKDTVWQNIFATDETDLDKLEKILFKRSERLILNEKMRETAANIECEEDRFSYREMLFKFKLSEEIARSMSENEDDQTDMPCSVHPYRLGKSPIEGTGYFLTVSAKAGDILAPARINDKRTPAGRYVNHSGNPNAEMKKGPEDSLYLVAIKDINGCMGGNIGTEVTTDYGKTFAMLNFSGEKICQEQ